MAVSFADLQFQECQKSVYVYVNSDLSEYDLKSLIILLIFFSFPKQLLPDYGMRISAY